MEIFENEMNKMEQNIQELWDSFKLCNSYLIGMHEEERTEEKKNE